MMFTPWRDIVCAVTPLTNIYLKIKILHLRQGSFTLATIFYRKNFCEKGYRTQYHTIVNLG